MVQLSNPHVDTVVQDDYHPHQIRSYGKPNLRVRSWSDPNDMEVTNECPEPPRLRLSISCPDSSTLMQLQSHVPVAPHGIHKVKRFFEGSRDFPDHMGSSSDFGAQVLQHSATQVVNTSIVSPTISHVAAPNDNVMHLNLTPVKSARYSSTDQIDPLFSPPTMRRKAMKSKKMTRRCLQWNSSSQFSSRTDFQDKCGRQRKWKLLRSIAIAKRRGIIPSTEVWAAWKWDKSRKLVFKEYRLGRCKL